MLILIYVLDQSVDELSSGQRNLEFDFGFCDITSERSCDLNSDLFLSCNLMQKLFVFPELWNLVSFTCIICFGRIFDK